MEEDLPAWKKSQNLSEYIFIATLGPILDLSSAENPAILWLQDGATEWHYYQEDFFSSCTRARAKVNWIEISISWKNNIYQDHLNLLRI